MADRDVDNYHHRVHVLCTGRTIMADRDVDNYHHRVHVLCTGRTIMADRDVDNYHHLNRNTTPNAVAWSTHKREAY
jgi:hypothetical protein